MIIHGDSLHELQGLESDSIDAVITDPPYGYSFMGKDWDKAVPPVDIWRECLRVLKPGAFMCVMSAPRSDVQNAMISRLMEAGFRLDFTPIYWTYASGFPKAGNIGKLVDKRLGVVGDVIGQGKAGAGMNKVKGFGQNTTKGGEATTEWDVRAVASDQAKSLEGSYAGFQPKPAVEVIIVAMKPLSEKTYVDQALKNGKGITWLDSVRVPSDDVVTNHSRSAEAAVSKGKYGDSRAQETHQTTGQAFGRFPANLLVSDQALNGHSKYFDLDAWAETLPFLAVPKASKSEKNRGLEHFDYQEPNYTKTYRPTAKESGDKGQNTPYAGTNRGGQMKNGHPTVKPLKLMSYLIALFTRPGDTVLDPFVGSGTTVVAAKQLDRNGIGIEREAEYAEIARARLAHITPLPEEPTVEPPITMDEVLDGKPQQMRLL